MLPTYTSHLGFETTVTFAEEKIRLFKSELGGGGGAENRVYFYHCGLTIPSKGLVRVCPTGSGTDEALGAPLVQ